jgi:hypothetical protein
MVVLVVGSTLMVAAPLADAASPIDTTLCSSTTSRMTVASNFPLAICFSGSTLVIKNTTDLMIQVNSEETSDTWLRKADTTNAVALAAAALDTTPYRLPPGFQVTAPIGSQASVFNLSLAPDENRLFWMDLVSSVIPGSAYGDYTAFSTFSDSMDSIHSSHQACVTHASNFLVTAACDAETAADVVSAIEALGTALLLANFTKGNLLSTADKKFAGLVSLAITLAETDESLFAGNIQLSDFINAPKIINISVASPTSVAVVTCPTQIMGGAATAQPTAITVNTALSGLPPMTMYTDAEGGVDVLAPSGWNCQAVDGVDGNTPVEVWPTTSPAPTNIMPTTGASGYFIPGCEGCMYDLLCPLFSASALSLMGPESQDQGPCPSTVPPGETDHTVQENVVDFTDPPGVSGTWDNSSGSYTVHGLVYFDNGSEPVAGMAGCALPTSEQAICSAFLNDFEARYVVSPSTPPSPSTTTTTSTTAASCPNGSQLFAAWSASPGVETAPPGTVTGFEDGDCWNNWVVAVPIGNGNGAFVFSQKGGLHAVSENELNTFSSEVCTDPSAPAGWRNPASGPAVCNQ